MALMSTHIQMAQFGFGLLPKEEEEEGIKDGDVKGSKMEVQASQEHLLHPGHSYSDYGSSRGDSSRRTSDQPGIDSVDGCEKGRKYIIEIHNTPNAIQEESTSGIHSQKVSEVVIQNCTNMENSTVETTPQRRLLKESAEHQDSRDSMKTLEEIQQAIEDKAKLPPAAKVAFMKARKQKSVKKVSKLSIRLDFDEGRPEGNYRSRLLREDSAGDIIRNPGRLLSRRRRKTRAEKKAKKAFRMITVIVGAFAIFWSPYYLVASIYGFCPNCIPPIVFTVSYYMCYLNSSINPFCYALANEQFQRVFSRIFKGDFRRK